MRLLSWKFGHICHRPWRYAEQGPSDSLFCYGFPLLRLTGFLQAMRKDLPLWMGHQQWSWQASMSDLLSIYTKLSTRCYITLIDWKTYSTSASTISSGPLTSMLEPSESFVGSLTLFLLRDFLLLFVALVVDFFVGCFFFRGGTIVRVTVLVLSSSRLGQKISD